MFNGDLVNRQSRHLADRLRREAGLDKGKQIELAYRLLLAREVTAPEKDSMLRFLAHAPLEQMARVMFNLNEFVYPD